MGLLEDFVTGRGVILNGPLMDIGSKDEELLTVEAIDNHVYFYSGVNPDRCLALVRELREIDNKLRNERLSRNLPGDFPPTPIWLHVQSGGGEAFAGLALADQLSQIHSPIYSIVEGYAASAATLITLACTRRYIQPNAFMMIHEVSGVAWGKYSEMKDSMILHDKLMRKLGAFYETHTTMSREKIDDLLIHDSWLDAPECLVLGLVDEVM